MTLALVLLALPAQAEEGPGLFELGIESVMRELLREMAPALSDLEGRMSALEGVLEQIDRYEAPEVLPNGDIIIRRKRDIGPEIPPGGEIEL